MQKKNTPENPLANVKHIDYKNTEVLRSFINQHARIQGRSRTGVSAKQQRRITQAIKRARFMGLLPYIEK